MRLYVLFLFLSFPSFAGSKVKCNEFQKLALDLENTIQNKTIEACKELTLTVPDLEKPMYSTEQVNFWESYRCKNLSEIEMAIKVLENEIALYDGIEKLVYDVKENQEEASNPELKQAEFDEAVKEFEASLDVAYSLETFINAPKDIIKDFSQFLIEDRNSVKEFHKHRKSICNKYSGTRRVHFCSKDFSITEKALMEINTAIKLAQNSEDPLSEKQIEEMKQAMSISVNDKTYSFKELKEELEKNPGLSHKDYKIIANLPKFESDKTYIQSLNEAGSKVSGHRTSRFKYALEDLKKRQEWEMKSKFSVIAHQNEDFKKHSQCKKIVFDPDFKNMRECTKALSKDNVNYESLDEALRLSQAQIQRLKAAAEVCTADPASEKCEKLAANKKAELTGKYELLKRLRDKLFANTIEVQMKDYVLQTLNNHCEENRKLKKEDLSICNESGINLDLNAIGLTLDVVDITMVFTNPADERKLEKICTNENKSLLKPKLCGLAENVPTNPTVTSDYGSIHIGQGGTQNRPEYKERKIKPRGGNEAMKQALITGGADIANSIAQAYGQLNAVDYPQSYAMQSPYAYSPQPYTSPSYAPMMMADTWMTNARMQANYGTYTPVMSYSSAGSNVATLSPYKNTQSSYFSLP